MIPRINELLQYLDRPAICLEYPASRSEAVSRKFAPQALEICSCGMSFSSFWRFEPGVEVAVSWEDQGATHTATGLVITCESDVPHSFRTTLYFEDQESENGTEKPARLEV